MQTVYRRSLGPGVDPILVRAGGLAGHHGAAVEEAEDHFYGERQYTPLT